MGGTFSLRLFGEAASWHAVLPLVGAIAAANGDWEKVLWLVVACIGGPGLASALAPLAKMRVTRGGFFAVGAQLILLIVPAGIAATSPVMAAFLEGYGIAVDLANANVPLRYSLAIGGLAFVAFLFGSQAPRKRSQPNKPEGAPS